MRAHRLQFLVGCVELLDRLVELLALGLDVEVDVVVDDNVDDPVAHAGGGARLALHELARELGVGVVRGAGELAHILFVLDDEVVLVELLQRDEEGVHAAHQLLARRPRRVELLEVGALGRHHVHDRGDDPEHGLVRVRVGG